MALGFSVGANEIQVVGLSGTRAAPNVAGRRRVLFPDGIGEHRTAEWAENQLGLLLDEFCPEAVAYKLNRGAATVKEIVRVYYSYAILDLLAHKRNLPVTHQNAPIRPQRLGLVAGADPRAYITATIGAHPPYWRGHGEDAAIVAYLLLP